MHPKRNLLLAAALSLVFSFALPAQTPAPPEQAQTGSMMAGSMMESCKQMMEMHQKMQSEMKAMDNELDRMVAEMNRTEGSRKIEAMAALLTRMVEQRKTMRTTMEDMQTRMMAHMSGHMQAGSSMANCPMMNGNGGMQHKHGQTTNKP